MADTMKGLKRTHYCGDVTEAGREVVVGGFVDRIRNKGGVIFIVLRDRTGVVQLLFNETTAPEIFEKASSCRSEFGDQVVVSDMTKYKGKEKLKVD